MLTCFTPPHPKIRLGSDNDGGYIIVDIPNISYSLLLSGGIGDDISFETQFIKKYNTKCIAYDNTIAKLPSGDNIQFINKNIGFKNNNNITNLHTIIENHNNIFVKMDIEGDELYWIKSLNNNHLNKFEQIVIEFHYPYKSTWKEVFEKLNKNHYLVHFHGNNCRELRWYDGVLVPYIFECTYLHKKHFMDEPSLNNVQIPSELDMPNIKERKDIVLCHKPFVN